MRRLFTLFELMLVMLLVSAVFGTLGFTVTKALKGEGFEQSVEQVISKIRLASELMLDYEMDVRLTFIQKAKGVELQFNPSKSIAPHMLRTLHKERFFKAITQMSLNGEVKKEITLHFNAQNGAMAQSGVLALCGTKEARINLCGNVAKIGRITHEAQTNQTKSAPYPQEVQETFSTP